MKKFFPYRIRVPGKYWLSVFIEIAMLTHIRRVLWAEDNISGIIDAMDAEEELGIIVDVPQTLKEAVALLETSIAPGGRFFDAIVSDGSYPLEKSGKETVEALIGLRRYTRDNIFFSHIPFIVLTGREPDFIRDAFRQAGAEDLIPPLILRKPQRIANVILIAERQLGQRAGFAASAIDSVGNGAILPKTAPEVRGPEYNI